MKEVLYRTRDLLERKLDESVNQGNLNPTELDCMYKAVKTLAQIATIEAMERAQWTEEESRRLNGMGQGYSYNDPYYMHESMRNRNALGQYAHHSTNDKMIAALENTITPDMTDMERQRVMEQIRMIRERKD